MQESNVCQTQGINANQYWLFTIQSAHAIFRQTSTALMRSLLPQTVAMPSWCHAGNPLPVLLPLLLPLSAAPGELAAGWSLKHGLCTTATVPASHATAKCCPSNEQQRT
jgi:hypothetical protein